MASTLRESDDLFALDDPIHEVFLHSNAKPYVTVHILEEIILFLHPIKTPTILFPICIEIARSVSKVAAKRTYLGLPE